jgi:hypothetical protein
VKDQPRKTIRIGYLNINGIRGKVEVLENKSEIKLYFVELRGDAAQVKGTTSMVML